MITSSFDPNSPPVFTTADIYPPVAPMAEVCIVTFSKTVMDHVLAHFKGQVMASIAALNGDRPVYLLENQGEGPRIAMYMSPTTSSASAMMMEDVAAATGIRRFVLFGSCGALDSALTEGHLIVPTEAYRDEGLSYHYAPAAPYIRIRNAHKVAGILKELGIPHVQGRAWTTDAIYRETRNNMEKRRAEGCIAVDMECSGLQAMCDFQGYEYFTFFYSGDLLDAPEWEQRILCSEAEKDHQLRNFLVALEIAKRVG